MKSPLSRLCLTLAAWVLSLLAASCRVVSTTPPPSHLEIALPEAAEARLSSEALLRRPSATSIVVSGAPAYAGLTLHVKVLPMTDLVPPRYAREDMSVVFECLDGFAATIPAVKVLGKSADGPHAFLAVEDPVSPWPPLKNHPEATAGPFYLVWSVTRPGQVAPEEWPYQIKRIAVREADGEFRGIRPEATAGAAVAAGFQVFVRNCSPCHTLNGVGEGRVGPDLNSPMSPTEYFREGIFERYVRNPPSVIQWSGQKMPSFSPDALSDAELASLRAYLAAMVPRKTVPPPAR